MYKRQELRGILLFQALSGLVDRKGEVIRVEKRGKNFLPNIDVFSFGTREEGGIRRVTIAQEQMQANQVPEVFLLDPWGAPYVYEFPRRDGHKGYLLFSKGRDGGVLGLRYRTDERAEQGGNGLGQRSRDRTGQMVSKQMKTSSLKKRGFTLILSLIHI